jgi:hypothetical protein
MTDRMTPTVPELKRITELANEHRRELVADLAPEFPGREAHALAAVLSIMFATSMTADPAQQSDQASILNEIMTRWQPVLPWQLLRRSN